MNISIYNNLENSVLTITSNYSNLGNIIKEENITKLYDENNVLVGLNVFDPSIKEAGYVSFDSLETKYKNMFDKSVNSAFVYGFISECEKHPKSDKLKVCQVDLGTETTQIVCGAPNCEKGYIAIVAKVDAVMPNGQKIVKSKLLDIESNGMLCSLKELGNQNQVEKGIKLFEENSREIGKSICKEDIL